LRQKYTRDRVADGIVEQGRAMSAALLAFKR
jgi:hypothetical protein